MIGAAPLLRREELRRPPGTEDCALWLDCSRWNDSARPIDWKLVAEAGIDGVIVRTSDGMSPDDRIVHLLQARDVGLPVEAYHYFRTHRDAREQTLLARHLAGDADLWLDLEDQLVGAPRFTVDMAMAWLKYGGSADLYTAAGYVTPPRIDRACLAELSKWRLWIADPIDLGAVHQRDAPRIPPLGGAPAWFDWDMWQVTGKGRVPGVGGYDGPITRDELASANDVRNVDLSFRRR